MYLFLLLQRLTNDTERLQTFVRQKCTLYIYVIFIFFKNFQIMHQLTIGAYNNIITKTERWHYLDVFQKSLTMSQNRKKKLFFLTTDKSRTPFRIDCGNQPRNFATNVCGSLTR
jgi:hypothetical protein